MIKSCQLYLQYSSVSTFHRGHIIIVVYMCIIMYVVGLSLLCHHNYEHNRWQIKGIKHNASIIDTNCQHNQQNLHKTDALHRIVRFQ